MSTITFRIILFSIILGFGIFYGILPGIRNNNTPIPESEAIVREESVIEETAIEKPEVQEVVQEPEYKPVHKAPEIQVQPVIQTQTSASAYIAQVRQEYSRLLSMRQQLAQRRAEAEAGAYDDIEEITGMSSFDPNQMDSMENAMAESFDGPISYIDAQLATLQGIIMQYQLGPEAYARYQNSVSIEQQRRLLEEINTGLDDIENYLRYGY